MRKLDRLKAPAPSCLARYQHGRHNWGDVSSEDRQEIQACLEKIQRRICAYCEGSLDDFGQHIEHFRPKGADPTQTFRWDNLYWSCDHVDSCGQHKDSKGKPYDVDDLIAPCVDDPDRFLNFIANGAIEIQPGLSEKDKRRATETIRVFNLDPAYGRLRRLRERQLATYVAVEPGITEVLMEWGPEDKRAFVEEELEKISTQPFSAIIRHYLKDAI